MKISTLILIGAMSASTAAFGADAISAKDFVNKAGEGGAAEVAMGKLGAQKATNAEVKAFAEKMVADHTKANKELMAAAKAKGLEVGVHDLRHDGKLYDSRAVFQQHADKINRYLQEWDAVGFRSAFMQRELEWLHDLDIAYDTSTFDTDPFEPQPEGVHTIFPFWCGAPDGKSGYLELPYTLPQDSTLFVVLEEKGIDIWKQKLDWIVERGGMALVNVHPDYIGFEGAQRPSEYPVNFYTELLEYVRTKFSGQYWNALPREVAEHFQTALVPSHAVS